MLHEFITSLQQAKHFGPHVITFYDKLSIGISGMMQSMKG